MSDTKTLAGALLAFQASPPAIHKTGENAAFKGAVIKYVKLSDLMDAVLPALNAQGLVWSTFPSHVDDVPVLRYTLTHAESGESMSDAMPLAIGRDATAQAQGSAITYARRYTLMAVLGLVGDDDDDGNGAGGRRTKVDRSDETPGAAVLVTALERLPDPYAVLVDLEVSTKSGEWSVADRQKIAARLAQLASDVPAGAA